MDSVGFVPKEREALIRFGYGPAIPATPCRAPADFIDTDDRSSTTR